MARHIEQYQDEIGRLYRNHPLALAGKQLVHNITFQVTDACNLRCTYCVTGDTKILMSDYTHKAIKDIVVGDNVLGFTEYPEKGHQDIVAPSLVTHLFQREAEVWEVELDTGEKISITPNHKVLTRRNANNHNYDFRPIDTLSIGRYVYTHPLASLPALDFGNEFSDDYKYGYLIGMLKGDGSLKHYINTEGYNVFKFRLAVKDIEIINRVKRFLSDLDISYYTKPYKVSKVEGLFQEAIFANTEETFHAIHNLYNTHFRKNKTREYFIGYLAGFYDAEGSINNDRVIRITNTNKEMIDEGCEGLNMLGIPYVIETSNGTKNKEHKYNIRILVQKNAETTYNFLHTIKSALPRKSYEKFLNYSPLKRSKIINIRPLGVATVYNIETECHTYIANGFAVHNCYQINKGHHVMSMDVAKRFIDMILDPDPDTAEYINSRESIACIIEFIGGEPFLEIDLIDEITDYFLDQLIIRDHPWQYNYMISICSNGVLYFDPKVQAYMKKHFNHLSFNISIDGNKQLHDSCRVFPDGSGSYDIAMAGVKHWTEVLGRTMGSKMTLAPANIQYTKDAVIGLIESGYDDINLNCVFEKGWAEEHATILYYQLKELADYLLENDLEDKIDLSIFVDTFFKPKSPDDTQTWCWGAGTPILTSTGYKPIETLQIGDLVYTADGTIHPIVDTKSHFADNCVILKTSGAYDMVCTDNHKLFGEPFDYLGNKNTKHYKPYGKYEVKDLVNNSRDKIELFRLPKGNIHVDENIAYLVGRYVGDGWDDANRLGHTICCAYNEQDELLEYFKKANVLYSLSPNKTVQQIRILYKGTELANNMLLHGYLDEAGHLATGKKVPYQVFSWDESSIRAFLQGYYDADGSKHSTGQIRCNSVSVDLMNGISLLLRTLGYNPVCNINKRGGTSTILGREVNIHNRYEMAYYEDATRSRYVMIDNNGKAWTAHNSITITEPQMVYNITVDKNHSYIAGGLVSSNCGGYGKMISVDYKGDIYPCIRYMESSLGTDVPPVIIGNVYEGIMARQEWKDCVHCMRTITRLTEFSQECLECPIAEGCAECAAYNYQDSGGCWNKRATYICIMHKARALANCYYWNLKYWKHGDLKRFKLWLSDEEALKIISQEELDNLKLLQFPLE